MAEWQPIETAPKIDGEPILISGGTYGCEFLPCEFYGAKFDVVTMAAWDEDSKQRDVSLDVPRRAAP